MNTGEKRIDSVSRLKKFSHAIDRLNDLVGRAVCWLSFFLVVLVTIDVSLRYIFNISFVAIQEGEWHLFALLFLLGAGYTLKVNGHVRVDVVYQRLSKRKKAVINLVGCMLFLFPGCLLVIHTSIPFVLASFYMHEGSPDPGGLPARYILKTSIPLGFSLLTVQGISMFLKNLLVLTERERG